MKDKTIPFFLLAVAVFTIDQLTKGFIKSHVSPIEVLRVMPFFNIVYAENTGAAFSMFRSLGNGFFIAVASVAIIAVAFIMMKDRVNRPGLSLILGGAAGNLADRIRYGYVVDFLDVYVSRHHWPSFNVADSALTVGIGLLMLNMFLKKEN